MGGIIGFGSSSKLDRIPKEYSMDAPCKKYNTNPNPLNYKIIKTEKIGNFLIVMINYPDCKNYEGNKILLFFGVTIEQLLEQKLIDPHFSNNEEKHSPIARFVPTDLGWALAKNLAGQATLYGTIVPTKRKNMKTWYRLTGRYSQGDSITYKQDINKKGMIISDVDDFGHAYEVLWDGEEKVVREYKWNFFPSELLENRK